MIEFFAKMVNHFRKRLHLGCLTGFWMRLCCVRDNYLSVKFFIQPFVFFKFFDYITKGLILFQDALTNFYSKIVVCIIRGISLGHENKISRPSSSFINRTLCPTWSNNFSCSGNQYFFVFTIDLYSGPSSQICLHFQDFQGWKFLRLLSSLTK